MSPIESNRNTERGESGERVGEKVGEMGYYKILKPQKKVSSKSDKNIYKIRMHV